MSRETGKFLVVFLARSATVRLPLEYRRYSVSVEANISLKFVFRTKTVRFRPNLMPRQLEGHVQTLTNRDAFSFSLSPNVSLERHRHKLLSIPALSFHSVTEFSRCNCESLAGCRRHLGFVDNAEIASRRLQRQEKLSNRNK